MEKYELCGAKGEISVMFLSTPSTANLIKSLSENNMILYTSYRVEENYVVLEIMVGNPLEGINS